MLELIQIPYSPFCIVQRRILEYSGASFKVRNLPYGDRSLVWKLSKSRYYQVPILKDDAEVIFETSDSSQVIAKYLDQKFELDLFPRKWKGLQEILWRYFEGDIEGAAFKLNDIHYAEWLPNEEHLDFIRHKERKFGTGCLRRWREQEPVLLKEFEEKLLPCEEMLLERKYLIDDSPRFVDFDLFGMLGNYLYSGHYKLPPRHKMLSAWYRGMAQLKSNKPASEKLHTRYKRPPSRPQLGP
jgi:glutathione S-transferase